MDREEHDKITNRIAELEVLIAETPKSTPSNPDKLTIQRSFLYFYRLICYR